MKIEILNIGKADCILINNNNFNIILDTGLNESSDIIISELNKYNIDSIDYMILSHYDKDHIGGACKIINSFNIKKVIAPNYSLDSYFYNNLIDTINSTKTTFTKISEIYDINNKGISINIYPTLINYPNDASNEQSLAVTLSYGRNSFLFTGDAKGERLVEILNQTNFNKFSLLKLPHHGALDEYSLDFIKSISPDYAIITCSKDDLPSNKILKLLAKKNITVYETYNGTVCCNCDQNNINIYQE